MSPRRNALLLRNLCPHVPLLALARCPHRRLRTCPSGWWERRGLRPPLFWTVVSVCAPVVQALLKRPRCWQGLAWPPTDMLRSRNLQQSGWETCLTPRLLAVYFFWSPRPNTLNSLTSVCCFVADKGLSHLCFCLSSTNQDRNYHQVLEIMEARRVGCLPQSHMADNQKRSIVAQHSPLSILSLKTPAGFLLALPELCSQQWGRTYHRAERDIGGSGEAGCRPAKEAPVSWPNLCMGHRSVQVWRLQGFTQKPGRTVGWPCLEQVLKAMPLGPKVQPSRDRMGTQDAPQLLRGQLEAVLHSHPSTVHECGVATKVPIPWLC